MHFGRENTETTMFDMYFKEEMNGEKVLVFKANIRKQYKYELEKNEKFSTEARMFYKIEEEYNVKCFNLEILDGDYTEEGYTKNINKVFVDNPNGYFKYFEEILGRDISGVRFNKRLYIIKHYILFSILSKNKVNIMEIKKFSNKLLIILLYFPGLIKTKKFIKLNI